MTPELESTLRERVAQALAWEAGEDPEPVTAALAYVLALDLLEVPLPVSPDTLEALRRRGSEVALALPSDDDLELEREATRAAIAMLAGRDPGPIARLATPLRPPPARLVAFLEGRLDGFAALGCAARLALDDEARSAVRDLASFRAPAAAEVAAPVALAAAPSPSMRAPAEGRPVLRAPGVEARLFQDGPVRRLAVYADEDLAVRLEAEGLVEESSKPGYWIGRLEGSASATDAKLRLGEELRVVRLDLEPEDA